MGEGHIDPTLGAFVGELVEVLYDPRDLAEIRIYHDGQFVCRALSPEHMAAPDVDDIIAARRKQRSNARKEGGQVKEGGSTKTKRTSALKLYSHED